MRRRSQAEFITRIEVQHLLGVDRSKLRRMQESGEVLIPLRERAITTEHFRTELGDVVTGAARGRRGDDDITLYNSIGVGIQDMATARLVVDIARRKGIGTELKMS